MNQTRAIAQKHPSKMLDDVIAWLCTTAMTAEEIARASGTNKWWVDRMRAGVVEDPGIRRVQAIHDLMDRIEGRKPQKLGYLPPAEVADRARQARKTAGQEA